MNKISIIIFYEVGFALRRKNSRRQENHEFNVKNLPVRIKVSLCKVYIVNSQ